MRPACFARSVGLALVLVLGSALSAHAADPTAADVGTARDLYREGSNLANEGRWEEAADRFRRSLTLKRAAITIYSLGLSLESSGHLVEALEAYRAFLREPVVDATRQFVAPAREAITTLEPKIGHLRINIVPIAGLRVSVDGLPVPAAALSARRPIDPGKHLVVARADGYRTLERSVEVGEGSTETLELSLEPATKSDPTAPSEISTQPTLGPEPDSNQAGPPLVGPIVLLASGAAVFGAGLAVGLIGVSEAEDAPQREGPEADAAMVKAIAGDVVAGVGIATAVAGGVWLIVGLTQRSAEVGPPKTAARLWSSGNTVGFSIDLD